MIHSTPVPVTVRDGVNALAIAEAAAQSLNLGRTVALSEVLPEDATDA